MPRTRSVCRLRAASFKSPEQAQANAVAANWQLTEAELVEVDRIVAGHGSTVLQ